jgi:hypothetical protein
VPEAVIGTSRYIRCLSQECVTRQGYPAGLVSHRHIPRWLYSSTSRRGSRQHSLHVAVALLNLVAIVFTAFRATGSEDAILGDRRGSLLITIDSTFALMRTAV